MHSWYKLPMKKPSIHKAYFYSLQRSTFHIIICYCSQYDQLAFKPKICQYGERVLSIGVITILRHLNILRIHYLYSSKCWTIKQIISNPFHQIVWRIPRVILITKFIYPLVFFISLSLLTLTFRDFLQEHCCHFNNLWSTRHRGIP